MDTPVFSRAAVVAPHALAAEAGCAVLAEGGTAPEAMVAMAATIAVAYPHMNAIGGDGFWLIRSPDGRIASIEAAGFAAKAATPDFYRLRGHDVLPARGPLAALTVPGAIGGWSLALEAARSMGGRLPLPDLLSFAVNLAKSGCAVSPSEVRTQPFENEALQRAPGFARAFLVDGKIPPVGTLRTMPALAATLEYLGRTGLDDFYRGDIAREMAADLERIESPLTREDFRRYEARWREPLGLSLPGVRVHNTAPPTQGLAALLLLGIFEQLDLSRAREADAIHGMVEATKRAFAIRDRVCIDDGLSRAELDDLLDDRNLRREADMVSMRKAARLPVAATHGDTVWMGAIDQKGCAVSFIQSIYWEYGSGCVLPATGVLMQNRGSQFSLDPASPRFLRPGKRPFHTLNPAMAIFDDGRVMPYGSMGGDGQPQFQAQIFARLRRGEDLARVLEQPRFLYGKTWGTATEALRFESRFDPDVVKDLRERGHVIEVHPDPMADLFGHAAALVRNTNGSVAAAHDPRSDGAAAGV